MMTDESMAPSVAEERPVEELVPVWLAALVLVLLLAVVGVAGYAIRARMTDTAPRTTEDIAVRNAEKAAAERPGEKQVRLDLGFAYQQAGQYDKALAEYDVVLKMDPKDTAALYNKGIVYFRLKQPKKAEAQMWDVLKISETHVLAAKALGEHYAAKGQYKSLVVAVKPAADARPDMADLQFLMGLAYENLGNKEWAIGRYRDALKYVPDYKEAREGLKRLGVDK